MRYLLRAILAGGLGFAVSLLIAACGGGAGLLSAGQSSTLSSRLDQISSALSAGNCNQAFTVAANLGTEVSGLPPSVSPTLRTNLIEGVSTVTELAQKDCHQTTSSPAPTTTPPPAVSTASTSPTTNSTTQSSTSTTTTTPPTTTSGTSSTPATTPSTSGTTPTGGTGGAGLGSVGGTSNGGPGLNATPGGGNSGNGK